MGRVSQDSIVKLIAFIESLPPEARGKCALCNETLTHVVKQGEAQTGAGTATVCRVLAEKVNEEAAPQDVVTEEALVQRVIQNTGDKKRIVSNGNNRTNECSKPETKEDIAAGLLRASDAMYFAKLARCQLEKIRDNDPLLEESLTMIIAWSENKIQEVKK